MRYFFFLLLVININAFTLNSLDLNKTFKQENAFNLYNCKGKNISPQLYWTNPPKNTKSFALTIYDIDAPYGWWHWIVINIPANIKKLKTNASLHHMPKGAIELKNSYNTLGYGGPCPPLKDKAHKYIFTIYALNIKKLDPKNKNIIKKIKKHTIQTASFIAFYKR